ncbi:MAG TPA: calcium/proton exchanger [Ktedonobacterales bacterium]|nr:calcium/proton exchanger [Ktedonobacterales bacterium]
MVKWLSPLIIALPVALLGQFLGWHAYIIFVLALIALVPLAAIIGHYTEDLGEYLGDVVGGLLDATFGNAPEIIIGLLLIIGVFPVVNALDIVKALIIGSIVSNVLLVLGSSVLAGAFRNGRMSFSPDRAGSYASMLALAVAGLALPALAVFLGNGENFKLTDPADKIHLSVVVSIVLLVSYAAYLGATIFHVGERPHPPRKALAVASETGDAGEANDEASEPHLSDEDSKEQKDRERRRALRKGKGRHIATDIVILLVATGLTVAASIVLVSQMNTVIVRTSLTPFFVGFILLPFICNVVEQLGAITAAFGNHMEETMAIAAGSSVQMALLVAPVLMLASLALGNPLTLVFGKTELIIVSLVTFVFALVGLDGESTWLEGLQLVAFYAMVVATAYFFPGA